MLASYITYFITIIVILFSLLLIYLKWALTYWRRKRVPYLNPTIPFGNFSNPLTNKTSIGFYYKRFYEELKLRGKEFGGVYSFTAPIFVPIHPDIVKLILLQEFSNFHDRGFYYNEKDQPVSASLLTVAGDRWRKLRTKLTPTFTSAKIKTMFHLMITCAKMLEQQINECARSKTPMNVGDSVRRMTTDVIGSCAFGIETNSYKVGTLYRTLENIAVKMTNHFKQTFCIALPNLARFLRIPQMPSEELNLILELLNETIEFRTEKKVIKNDFLQLLLDMKKDGVIDVNEVQAQCVLFFLAGYETTASTLTFALYELAYNENVQKQLKKEVVAVIAKHDGVLTYEAVQEMKYLQMVIDETLRKYPPIATLKRKCTKDFTIPNTNIVIEKNTAIFIPMLGFHYDPEYFSNPDKFIPERFSEENLPNTYLPFGLGPRNCIGDRFGKLQVKIGIISFIRNYKFKLNHQVQLPLPYFSGFADRPNILLDIELIAE
ncbi:cytochrome p450 [Holotrichia oblita]|uniref:Cytochrome p450 n=1 Tax=Holotrichia oblita TaxID=644536 RepID=A0ACB9T7N6_HOLOL|nr:cytochrome p450 [Holotrichia oblita]